MPLTLMRSLLPTNEHRQVSTSKGLCLETAEGGGLWNLVLEWRMKEI